MHNPLSLHTLFRATAPAPQPAPAPHRCIESTQLLAGEREVLIRHGENIYRLRRTGNDKLILTK